MQRLRPVWPILTAFLVVSWSATVTQTAAETDISPRQLWDATAAGDPFAVFACDPSYPDFCVPPPPPDLNCDSPSIKPHKNFRVLPPDPHGFDGNRNGVGCEDSSQPTRTPTPTPIPVPPTSTPTATSAPEHTGTPTSTPIQAPPTSTPTVTSAPQPTLTPVPEVSCSPRPPVAVRVVRNGPDQIIATIGVIGSQNTLRQVRFAGGDNALAASRGQSGPGAFTVSLPSGLTEESFTVNRITVGHPMHLPLVVVDGCGEWHTFVGAGAGQ